MTDTTKQSSIVAIYDLHTTAEDAVKALQRAGLDMTRFSIVGRDFQTEEHALGFYTSGDRMRFWGGRGAFWGSLWGMLFGGAFFFIPTVGPLVVMGPLVGWLAGALEGAVLGGAGGILAAALTSSGLSNESVVRYELEVKAGKFLVLAQGSADMVELARAILGTTGASHLAVHAPWSAEARRTAERAVLVSRASLMKLLSDDEVARVSTVEASARLLDGDEYVDLEHIERGVQWARGTTTAVDRALPRKAVHANTWNKILTQVAR